MTIHFSHNFGHEKSPPNLTDIVRRAENQGFYALYAADHIGIGSPFVPLSFMAAHSTSIKLGTLALNAAFYNTGLLYRELETLFALLADRLIIGIGAGHMKSEFTEIGLPFPSYPERIAHLKTLAAYIREKLPATTLLLAGSTNSSLSIAAEYADIIGVGGLIHKPGSEPGSFQLVSPDGTRKILNYVQSAKHICDKKLQVLIQRVSITQDIDQVEKELSKTLGLNPLKLRENPYLLYGNKTAIVEKVHYLHEQYGFQEFTTHFPYSQDLAEIIPYFS